MYGKIYRRHENRLPRMGQGLQAARVGAALRIKTKGGPPSVVSAIFLTGIGEV